MRKILRILIAAIIVFCLSFALANTIYKAVRPKEVVSLLGCKIFIDPGHGGKDNGACREEVVEDEINLHIATYLFEKCLDEGADALISRTGDYDLASLYAKNRKQEDLRKRVEYINQSEADLFISIHVNAINMISVHGPMVYYRQGDEKSKTIATSLADELNSFAASNKPIHGEDYYLFRKTTIPGVLVECGFLSNDQERNQLLNTQYQKRLADTIYKGISQYFHGQKI